MWLICLNRSQIAQWQLPRCERQHRANKEASRKDKVLFFFRDNRVPGDIQGNKWLIQASSCKQFDLIVVKIAEDF